MEARNPLTWLICHHYLLTEGENAVPHGGHLHSNAAGLVILQTIPVALSGTGPNSQAAAVWTSTSKIPTKIPEDPSLILPAQSIPRRSRVR